MDLRSEQQVFMLFFAIIWGTVANVQPRWKAFQLPLFFRVPVARNRVLLSVAVLNVLPLVFFGYALWALAEHLETPWARPFAAAAHLVVHGIIPAFAVFGFYRLWVGIVELWPTCFYAANIDELDPKYHHVEPTFRTSATTPLRQGYPTIDLDPHTAWPNVFCAGLYIVAAGVAPWLCFWR